MAPADTNARHGHGLAFVGLIIGNILLACGPWLVRLADVGPIASAFWRVGLAFPLLVAMARVTRQQLAVPPKLAFTLLLGGALFGLDLASWHSGIILTKLANASLFGNIASFFFAAYGFFVARTMPNRLQSIALLLAAVGLALLLGRSYELSPQHFLGDLLCIIAGLLFALYLIAMDHARGRIAPWPVLAWSTAGAIPVLLVINLTMGQALVPQNWAPVVLLAIASQVIGQGLMVYAMGHLSPVIVGIALLLQPVVAASIGWIFYAERLTMADLAGMAAVAIAIILIRYAAPPKPRTA